MIRLGFSYWNWTDCLNFTQQNIAAKISWEFITCLVKQTKYNIFKSESDNTSLLYFKICQVKVIILFLWDPIGGSILLPNLKVMSVPSWAKPLQSSLLLLCRVTTNQCNKQKRLSCVFVPNIPGLQMF